MVSQTLAKVNESLKRAISFLLAKQSADGAWRDFLVKPGVSDSWVTAYVGCALLESFSSTVYGLYGSSLENASRWLQNEMQSDGGWGYNNKCHTDADSTAYSILFLHGDGLRPPLCSYERLLKLQMPDGGFATYEPQFPEDSWGISHPDVSPVALRALQTRFPVEQSAIRRGREYVLSQLQVLGLWQSFWWTTPLYSTLANLQFLEGAGTWQSRARVQEAVISYSEFACIHPTRDPFQTALFAEILAILGCERLFLKRIAWGLVDSQHPDGGWNMSAMLRVPDRHCIVARPEKRYIGEVAWDIRRIFTTATVISSLSSIKKRMFGNT